MVYLLRLINIITGQSKIYKLLLIACGGAGGALLRWQSNNDFIVNLLGSGLLGFLFAFKQILLIKLFLGFGLCGSLTTFSGWIMHSVQLVFDGNIIKAIYSIFFPLVFGLILAIIGFTLGNRLKIIRHSQ